MNVNFRIGEENWRDAAACRGLDPAKWYPHTGERNDVAKAVCATCPVRSECLEFAIASREDFGIWGGLSERERRSLARKRYGPMPQMARTPRPKRQAS